MISVVLLLRSLKKTMRSIIRRSHILFQLSMMIIWNKTTIKGITVMGMYHRRVLPQVNLKNVLSGIANILIGRNKDLGSSSNRTISNSNVAFLEYEKDGDTCLHPSVYTPSALPLLEPNTLNYRAYKEVLQAEPPDWLPDSSSTACMQCNAPFTAVTRGRHHCRFCGGIFCRACSKGRCLLPVKFRERDPQRVCETCYDRLDPLQSVLVNTISNAAQTAKHDVMDWTCARGWLNLPVGLSMEHEIYKAASTLRSYGKVDRLNPEKSIPAAVLNGAKGLAIITVAKAGVLVSYKLGTGLVVARKADGSWSAPSAICSLGMGWGAQVGGELMDFIIVLLWESHWRGISLPRGWILIYVFMVIPTLLPLTSSLGQSIDQRQLNPCIKPLKTSTPKFSAI